MVSDRLKREVKHRLTNRWGLTAHRLKNGRVLRGSRHPYFDPEWYRSTYAIPDGIDPAKHFLAQPPKAGFDPHPLLDTDWYLQFYPAVALSGLTPAQHFTEIGWTRGMSPSPSFDTAWYLSEYPDVLSAGVDPLRHYIDHGRAEGRYPRRLDQVLLSVGQTHEEPAAIPRVGPVGAKFERPSVDIVIPVFGQWHFTDRCLRALSLSEARHETRVLVIDDAGPEDSNDIMSRHPWVEYRRLPLNVGYTKATNLGLRDTDRGLRTAAEQRHRTAPGLPRCPLGSRSPRA